MKKSLILGIIGCAVLIGAAVLFVIKHTHKTAVEEYNDDFSDKNDSDNIISEENGVDSDVIKTETVSSMSKRHKLAAQIISESVEKMNDDTELPIVHDDEFDDMLKDLDVLSEEE